MTSTHTETPHHTAANMGQGTTPTTRRRRTIALTIFCSVFLILCIIWLIYWLIWGQFEVYTDDAYVNGNIVQLMPQIKGTVIEINTDDTQFVLQGQPIIKLDPTDTKIALQRAQAMLGQTVRQVKQYFENAEEAQATLIARHAELMKAQLDVKRRVGLVGERAVSKEEMQHYRTSSSVTKAQYELALHHLRAALALVENADVYTHPLVERAKAQLLSAYLNHERTLILAPVTGIVAKRSVQVGQQVAMNTPMLAIIPLQEIWVDANYKESQLADIRVNQPVTLYADAYPAVTYHGKVVGLNAGTGAAFSLLPPQNATGNWIKIVQRLPVHIKLDDQELKKNPLQLGLSMRVTIDIHDTKGSRMVIKPQQKPVYQTPIYEQQLAHAHELIERILKENATNMTISKSEILNA